MASAFVAAKCRSRSAGEGIQIRGKPVLQQKLENMQSIPRIGLPLAQMPRRDTIVASPGCTAPGAFAIGN